jgi:hypothetical protein
MSVDEFVLQNQNQQAEKERIYDFHFTDLNDPLLSWMFIVDRVNKWD